MRRIVTLRAVYIGVLACACSGDSTAPLQPRAFSVANDLVLSVSVQSGGTTLGTVQNGSSATVELPAGANSLTFTLYNFTYGDGSAVPNDYLGGIATLSASDVALNIDNIVNGQPYFAFRIFNNSGVGIDVGQVENGLLVRCLGSLPDLATQYYGYYAFTSGTTVRAYSGAGCSGTSNQFWSNTTLSGFAVNSGFIALTITSPP
jgi:hypothetical protein